MIEGRIELTRGTFRLAADFSINSFGVTGVAGPSGSGKSTFLRFLAGLPTGASGRLKFGEELWLDSARHVNVPAHERGIGYVLQHAALFPHMDVKHNVLYAMARRPAACSGPDFAEIADRAGINHLLERRVATLSGGERQRVAIARALGSAPRMLLLDEPVSALDLDSRGPLLSYFEQLCRGLAIPVVYVSHNPEELRLLADGMLRIEDGTIKSVG
jgi:molybdate transport system ATP-binding protein